MPGQLAEKLRPLAAAGVLAGLLAAWPALAADLNVVVTTPGGKAVADAVVMVHARAGGETESIRFPWPLVVEQRNMQFQPFVLIVPVGGQVEFPNRDPFRHHVYSFSPAKTFELKLYGQDETRTVKFDKPGVVALGCNIHDDMAAFIRVVDTPFAVKTGARGEAVIHNLPAGQVTVSLWHPYLKGGRDLVREATLPAAGALRLPLTADLRAAPLARGTY